MAKKTSGNAAHPHRGPSGIKMPGVTGQQKMPNINQHDHHAELGLGGHTFGMEGEYKNGGTDHHLGCNADEQD